MLENIIAGILIGLIILSAATVNHVVEESIVDVPIGYHKIGNITFVFVDKVPYDCAQSKASGCAFYWNNTVFLINHDYLGYEGLRSLCNHELCHIYKSLEENICIDDTMLGVSYWECDELVKRVS